MQHRLKELREDLNLRQSDIFKGICSRYTYSRLENGSQEIPFELLDRFLKRMGVPLRQYLNFLETYDDSNQFQKIEDELPELIKKDKFEQQLFLDTTFRTVQQNRFKNIYALLVFVQVKSMLKDRLKVKVSALTKLDKQEIEEFYRNRSCILPIDLAILANIAPSYTCEEWQPLEHLITKKINIKNLEDIDFKKITAVYLNFLICSIRQDNLSYAEHYLKKIEQLLDNKINYYLQAQYSTFKYIVEFIKTEDIMYLQHALEVINLIEHFKDKVTSAHLRQEINKLLKMKNIKVPDELLIAGGKITNSLPMLE